MPINRTAIFTTIALLILIVLSFVFTTPAHAQRIGHQPLNVYGPFAAPHKLNPLTTVVDLHNTGVATANIHAKSWSMIATCSGEGQMGVIVRDNQGIEIMPAQVANCDGRQHTLGTYSSTGQFTFQVVSHARTLHFIVIIH